MYINTDEPKHYDQSQVRWSEYRWSSPNKAMNEGRGGARGGLRGLKPRMFSEKLFIPQWFDAVLAILILNQ